VGAHESPLDRLSLTQWLRYRRLYRALVISAGRHREPLDRRARAVMKEQARRVAREAGLPAPRPAGRAVPNAGAALRRYSTPGL
jgi:hypothetical protein